LYVQVLYFNQALILLKMCTSISMYLFRSLVHVGFRRVVTQRMRGLLEFGQLKVGFENRIVCIKLAPSSAGISFTNQFLGIELAYSHSVLFRLFDGLMGINCRPVFLLISLCMSLVFGVSLLS